MIQEYIRAYFTTESVDLISELLKATPSAGKLVSEYNQTEQGMFENQNFITGQLYDELDYINSRDAKFYDKIDMLIQQETMSSVVTDILSVLQEPLQNDTKLSEKLVSINDLRDIVAQLDPLPLFNSIQDLPENEQTEPVYNSILTGLQTGEDAKATDIVEQLGEFKNIGFLFKEYRDSILRKLQENQWKVGKWSFEDGNQILAKVEGKEIRILAEGEELVVDGQRFKPADYNSFNQRGEFTYQRAISQKAQKNPDMACHFSGNYESNPSWRMNFDQQYYVKSVKIFNA